MKEKKSIRTMDIILAVIAVFLLLFIVVMIWLCTCVFAACGGECGVMGWIKTTKERQRERSFELEDREHNEKIQKEGL